MIQRRTIAVACASLFATVPAWSQEKPPIRLLVGFPPGGSADTVARMLAEKMRVTLGQNVIVDNKPGAAGRVALGEVKRAAPDGQTLVLAPSGALVVSPWLYKNLGFDPVRDFTPVARAVTFDFAITAGPAAPSGDLKTVLAWMKNNPAKANFGTPGAGTVPHFTGVLLSQVAGVTLTHVAYKGGAPSVHDLLGGQIPLVVDTPLEVIEHHRAGKLRILAVTGETRNKSLPEVPTLKELGIDMAADAYFAVYGPAGMPADLTARIGRAVADALRQGDVSERILNLGLQPAYSNGDELAATQAAHLKRWEAPIKASGFTAE
ncbi:MAG: Bug family tripartite tricarboxylate transporter substrate binding protein [Burkholderiaceae bacterium]|nr:Bug family tripartite tricarboxylate transporter substrate binding protein [Burkholderiaceae bacterium]